MTIRKIVLYGEAAKKFGKEHQVDADTTFMVFRGLTHILGRAFKQTIINGKFRIFKNTKGSVKKNALSELQVHQELAQDVHTLHVVPVIKGASGQLRIVVGLVLMAYGTFGTAYGGGPWATSLGASLVIGGVASLIAPTPPSAGASLHSFNFNGPQNSTAQGGPVPLVYGKVGNIGGTMISAGMTYERI